MKAMGHAVWMRVLLAGVILGLLGCSPVAAPSSGQSSPSPSASGTTLAGNPSPAARDKATPAAATDGPFNNTDQAAVAYDEARAQVVMFGGRRYPSGLNPYDLGETWTWNAGGWKRAALTGPAPGPRVAATMGYDRAHGLLVLFGGMSTAAPGFSYFGDTWTWDGTAWKPRSPATVPKPRASASMAWDSNSGRLIMFGGATDNNASFNATWSWDGNDWTLLNPVNSPPARRNAGLAFDETRNVLVLYGGTRPLEMLSDTWTYDDRTWTQQHPATDPGGGWASLAYEPASKRLAGLALSGPLGEGVQETWFWDGAAWNSGGVGSAAPAAYGPGSMMKVVSGAQVLLGVGGTDSTTLSGTQVPVHTWDGSRWLLR
jgi:hypothetical protein